MIRLSAFLLFLCQKLNLHWATLISVNFTSLELYLTVRRKRKEAQRLPKNIFLRYCSPRAASTLVINKPKTSKRELTGKRWRKMQDRLEVSTKIQKGECLQAHEPLEMPKISFLISNHLLLETDRLQRRIPWNSKIFCGSAVFRNASLLRE